MTRMTAIGVVAGAGAACGGRRGLLAAARGGRGDGASDGVGGEDRARRHRRRR